MSHTFQLRTYISPLIWTLMLLIVSLSLLPTQDVWAAKKPKKAQEKLALTGVMILGNYKLAMVDYNGQSLNLKLRDPLGEWEVKRIDARTVTLFSTKTKKEKILHLLQPSDDDGKAAKKSAKAKPAAPKASNDDKKDNKAFKPRVIEDQDIPEGHRRVRTPFGDVLVKDDKK